MKRSRLSILGMMAFIVPIAVGFAALRTPTILGASLVFTATVAILGTAILGAIARRGRARMTWAGVAVFGWAYVLMSFGPFPNGNGVRCPPFPTQWALESLKLARPLWRADMDNAPGPEGLHDVPETVFQAVAPGTPGAANPPGTPGELLPAQPGPTMGFGGGTSPGRFVPTGRMLIDRQNQRRIGHSLGALLFGLIGALIGRTLAGRDDPPAAERMTAA